MSIIREHVTILVHMKYLHLPLNAEMICSNEYVCEHAFRYPYIRNMFIYLFMQIRFYKLQNKLFKRFDFPAKRYEIIKRCNYFSMHAMIKYVQRRFMFIFICRLSIPKSSNNMVSVYKLR